jgi:signal transduction histidine kinase
MADRMAAIGGGLDVKTSPGRGTNVVGRIPLS